MEVAWVMTLLVVDDEKFIRQGIRTIIARLGEFDKIYEAKNGSEALEIVVANSVDIVITDIRMPIMDGITLIKHLKEYDLKIKTVILSGFDEFRYAKDAISYGAKAYLLKPVDRNELTNIVYTLAEEIKKEKDEIRNQISQATENTLNLIFFSENIKDDSLKEVIANLNIEVLKNPFYLSILISQNNVEDDAFLISYVQEYYENEDILCFQNIKGQCVIITPKPPDHEFVMDVSVRFENKYYLCISEQQSESKLRNAYDQAMAYSKYSMLLDEYIIESKTISDRKKDYKIPNGVFQKMFNMIIAKRTDEAIALFSDIFKECGYVIEYYEDCAELFYRDVIYNLETTMPTVILKIRNDLGCVKSIYGFKTIYAYRQTAIQYIKSTVANDELQVSNTTQNKEIETAIKYINDNFNQDINLAMVSNSVSISYSYFSLIFKDKTGVSFTDYLKRVRIDKAKELLKSTNKKIYEIAGLVGYENPKQFMKVFRKTTGISPSEYREQRGDDNFQEHECEKNK